MLGPWPVLVALVVFCVVAAAALGAEILEHREHRRRQLDDEEIERAYKTYGNVEVRE